MLGDGGGGKRRAAGSRVLISVLQTALEARMQCCWLAALPYTQPSASLCRHPLAPCCAAQKVIPTGFTTAQQIFEQRKWVLLCTLCCSL